MCILCYNWHPQIVRTHTPQTWRHDQNETLKCAPHLKYWHSRAGISLRRLLRMGLLVVVCFCCVGEWIFVARITHRNLENFEFPKYCLGMRKLSGLANGRSSPSVRDGMLIIIFSLKYVKLTSLSYREPMMIPDGCSPRRETGRIFKFLQQDK